ncbi:MAG: hypothetical protein R3E79_53675 [Caldilineaceae bacterium]
MRFYRRAPALTRIGLPINLRVTCNPSSWLRPLYHGPSADQSQMLVIDWLLYGQSYPAYLRFFDSLAQHLRPQHRQIMAWYTKRYGVDVSLLDIVRNTYPQSMAIDAAQTTISIDSIITSSSVFAPFRYPHRKIAIDSFAIAMRIARLAAVG